MGEGTTLGDLLELQLHRVEDEVKNIVDKAVKEMSIEKVSIRKWCAIFTVPNNSTTFTAFLHRIIKLTHGRENPLIHPMICDICAHFLHVLNLGSG